VAVARVLSRLPLTAWFALPTLALPAARRARRSEASGESDPPRDGDATPRPGLTASGTR
jgi:hypothetical protein